MNTPRQILLEKHQAAQAHLDQIASDVVRQTARYRENAFRPASRWTDWFWPSPAAWGAVAAAWVVILGLHLAGTSPRPARPTLARQTPATLQALRAQRELLVELVTPPGREPEPARPRRRSELVLSTVVA
jgi:hypothetical protein